MKKLITILVLALCGITTTALADEGAGSWDSYDNGDMNCDGQVNVLDAVALVASILNNEPEAPCGVNVETECDACEDCADCAEPKDYCGPGTELSDALPLFIPCFDFPWGGFSDCEPTMIDLGPWCMPTDAHDDAVFDEGYEAGYDTGKTDGIDSVNACEGESVEWAWVSLFEVLELGDVSGASDVDFIPVPMGSYQCVPTSDHDDTVYSEGYDDGAESIEPCEGDDVELVWHSGLFVPFDGVGASIPILPSGYYTCEPTEEFKDTTYSVGYGDCKDGIDPCEGDNVEWNDECIETCTADNADEDCVEACTGSCEPTDDFEGAAYDNGYANGEADGIDSVHACEGDDVAWTWVSPLADLEIVDGAGNGGSIDLGIIDTSPVLFGTWQCLPTDDFEDTTYWSGYDDGKAEGIDACPACGEDDACGVTSLYEDDCGVCGGPGLNDDGCCGDETMDCHGDCGGQGVEDDCGVCDGDGSTCLGPECTDDADWESDWGSSCSSYALGQANHTYCDGDTGWDGVLAAEACPAACAAPGDDCWVDPECQYEHFDQYKSSGTCVESIACCYFVGGYGNGVNWLVCESGWAEVSMCQETIIN